MWHYSRTMPASKVVRLGVWENGRFIGAIIFGVGSGNATDGRRYGLTRNGEMAELVRVALRKHKTPVSRLNSIALKMVKRANPGIRLVVSFADPAQGHHGGIYQAGGWIYTGRSAKVSFYRTKTGRMLHSRVVSESGIKSHFGKRVKARGRPSECERIAMPGKYRYLFPLDPEIRSRVTELAQPYPKRGGSDTVDTPGHHPGEGGSTPTPPLHSGNKR